MFECLDKRGRVRLCIILRQFDGLELWVLLYEMMHVKTDITLHHSPTIIIYVELLLLLILSITEVFEVSPHDVSSRSLKTAVVEVIARLQQ